MLRQTLVCVAALVTAAGLRAETYSLAEKVEQGDCFHYHLEMTLTGEMRISKNNMPTTLKMSASAGHAFPERILAVSQKGIPEKVARSYESAKAVISVGERAEKSLRTERRLFVAQRHKGEPLVYCPAGTLVREELELTSEHFDTLTLVGLLPGKEVAVGDTWKVDNDTAQALCAFEGLTEQSLACKLEEVKGETARVSVKGSAKGIELGALVKLDIDAIYTFDLTQHRLVAIDWKQKDERDQGPASPALTMETTTTVKRASIAQPAGLDDVALVSIPDSFEPPPEMLQLYYRDPKDRFVLNHGREWQQVGHNDKHLVLRLMERGDFVAQATVTPWTSAKSGEHLKPEEFQKAMSETSGWEQGEVLEAKEVKNENGRWVYRVSATGQMDGIEVTQTFYLVAGPGGEQVVVAFTMTPKKVSRLAARDLALVGTIDFPGTVQEGGPGR